MNVANRLPPDIALASLAYPENPVISIPSTYLISYTTSYPLQATVSSRRRVALCVLHHNAVVHARGSVSVTILKHLTRR